MRKSVKKGIIIGLSVLASLIVLFFVAVASLYAYFDDENKRDDAERIARKNFHFDEIFVIVSGSSYSEVVDPDRRTGIGYIYYVLGERNGEDACIIVPWLKSEEPYEAEWPLCEPFEACMEKFSEVLGRPVTKEDYVENLFAVDFIDTKDEIERAVPPLKGVDLDVNFMIEFKNNYFMAQIDGELVVYVLDFEWFVPVYAMEEFGLDEVLTVSRGTAQSEVVEADMAETKDFLTYVVGKRYGREMFIVFFTSSKMYALDWVFCESFETCMEKFGEYLNQPITKEDYAEIYFLDNKEDIEEAVLPLRGVALDVNFVIQFKEDYFMAQINEELVIYAETSEGWVSSQPS